MKQMIATNSTSMANIIEYSHFTISGSTFTNNEYSDAMIRTDYSFVHFDQVTIDSNHGRLIRATQTDSLFSNSSMTNHTGDDFDNAILNGGNVTDVCDLYKII